VWEQVAGAIYNDGNEGACEPLVNWLRVALVREAAGELPRLAHAAPVVPLATPRLVE